MLTYKYLIKIDYGFSCYSCDMTILGKVFMSAYCAENILYNADGREVPKAQYTPSPPVV
jgi:hypothetical protein